MNERTERMIQGCPPREPAYVQLDPKEIRPIAIAGHPEGHIAFCLARAGIGRLPRAVDLLDDEDGRGDLAKCLRSDDRRRGPGENRVNKTSSGSKRGGFLGAGVRPPAPTTKCGGHRAPKNVLDLT